MFGFSAFSQAPFSALGGASGPFTYNVSVSEAANVTNAQTNVVTFVASQSETVNTTASQTYKLTIVAAQSEAIQSSAAQTVARFVPAAIAEQFYANAAQVASFTALGSISEAVNSLSGTQLGRVTYPVSISAATTAASTNSTSVDFDGRSNEAISVAQTFAGRATQYVNISENTTAENLNFSIRTSIVEQVENARVTSTKVGGLLINTQIADALYYFSQIENNAIFRPSISTAVNLRAASDSEFIILGEMSEGVQSRSSLVALGANFQFMTEAINASAPSVARGTFPAAQSESASVLGTQIGIGTYITAIEEGIAIFDGFDGLIVWILNMAEAINASATFKQNQGYDVNINESIQSAAAITKSVAFLASIAQAFNATAAQSNTVGFLTSVAQSINAFAFNDTASDIRVNVDENVFIQDAFDQGYSYSLAVAEAVNIAVNLVGIKYFNYFITDGVRATSTQSGRQIATGNVSDSIQSASFYGNLATYFDSINEFANIIQLVDGLGTFYVSLGDQISVTQSFSVKEKWAPADNTQNANWTDPSNNQVPNWNDPVNDQVPNWDPVNSI